MLRFLIAGVTAWCDQARNTQSTKAIEFKPYIAIIDYSLPLISGIGVTRQIWAQLPKPKVLSRQRDDCPELLCSQHAVFG
jgi:DNA-binding NarL/FixJ family response regulator